MPGHTNLNRLLNQLRRQNVGNTPLEDTAAAVSGAISGLADINFKREQQEKVDERIKEEQRRYEQTREDLNFERAEAKRLELKQDQIREEARLDRKYSDYVKQAGGDIESLDLLVRSDSDMVKNASRYNLNKITEQSNAVSELKKIYVANPATETTEAEFQAIIESPVYTENLKKAGSYGRNLDITFRQQPELRRQNVETLVNEDQRIKLFQKQIEALSTPNPNTGQLSDAQKQNLATLLPQFERIKNKVRSEIETRDSELTFEGAPEFGPINEQDYGGLEYAGGSEFVRKLKPGGRDTSKIAQAIIDGRFEEEMEELDPKTDEYKPSKEPTAPTIIDESGLNNIIDAYKNEEIKTGTFRSTRDKNLIKRGFFPKETVQTTNFITNKLKNYLDKNRKENVRTRNVIAPGPAFMGVLAQGELNEQTGFGFDIPQNQADEFTGTVRDAIALYQRLVASPNISESGVKNLKDRLATQLNRLQSDELFNKFYPRGLKLAEGQNPSLVTINGQSIPEIDSLVTSFSF
tara:strand:+ start:2300 stop:3865 length:1566 start_codon:yes stop_codon:yes gene_type:complete